MNMGKYFKLLLIFCAVVGVAAATAPTYRHPGFVLWGTDIDANNNNITNIQNLTTHSGKELQNPELGASYIIFTDGVTIYAKNGSTGKIEYDGTDFGDVINNIISDSVMIQVTSGIFNSKTAIVVTNNSCIQGVGASTVVNVTSAVDAFSCHGITDFKIKDMKIDGNDVGIVGINISSDVTQNIVDSFAFENLHIIGFTDGVRLDNSIVGCRFFNILSELNSEDGFDIEGSDHTFVSCESRTNDAEGWYLKGTAQTMVSCIGAGNGLNGLNVEAQDSTIVAGYFDRNDRHGVYLGGHNNTLIGGHMYYNNKSTSYDYGCGISISGDDIRVISPRVGRPPEGSDTNTQQFNIYASSGASNVIIESPILCSAGSQYGNYQFDSNSVFMYNAIGESPFDFGNRASAPSPYGEGDSYYNTNDHKKYVYNGTAWNALW